MRPASTRLRAAPSRRRCAYARARSATTRRVLLLAQTASRRSPRRQRRHPQYGRFQKPRRGSDNRANTRQSRRARAARASRGGRAWQRISLRSSALGWRRLSRLNRAGTPAHEGVWFLTIDSAKVRRTQPAPATYRSANPAGAHRRHRQRSPLRSRWRRAENRFDTAKACSENHAPLR